MVVRLRAGAWHPGTMGHSGSPHPLLSTTLAGKWRVQTVWGHQVTHSGTAEDWKDRQTHLQERTLSGGGGGHGGQRGGERQDSGSSSAPEGSVLRGAGGLRRPDTESGPGALMVLLVNLPGSLLFHIPILVFFSFLSSYPVFILFF